MGRFKGPPEDGEGGMSRWFRMYDDLLDDPKVQRLEPVLFKAWVNFLCLASRNDGVLPPTEDIAFVLRIDEGVAELWLAQLAERGLIDDIEGETKPHNWDKRQFRSDRDETAADRKRRHRAKSTDVTRDVTGHVTRDTPEDVTRTEQSRTDTEQSRAESDAREGDPKHWKEAQDYLQDRLKDLTDWEVEFLHSVKWKEKLTKDQAAAFKSIQDKMKANPHAGQEVFVVKNGTPPFDAWIAYKRAQGLKTAFLEKQPELTVPSLMPPEVKAA